MQKRRLRDIRLAGRLGFGRAPPNALSLERNVDQPCEWVGDRLTVDEMVPLSRLDDAVGTTCLGLVLRDGSIVSGRARP